MRRRALLVGAVLLAGCSYGAGPDKRLDFVLFYPGESTTLDPAARAVISHAAAAAAAAPDLRVTVSGFADSPAAPESNQIRSRIRAQLVADALLREGVARSRIRLAPHRALGGDPGVESARVEIRIGS